MSDKLYCLRNPAGRFCEAYMGETEEEVSQKFVKAENRFYINDPDNAAEYEEWDDLKRAGYEVIKVKIVED